MPQAAQREWRERTRLFPFSNFDISSCQRALCNRVAIFVFPQGTA
jgi:hypothetical protein